MANDGISDIRRVLLELAAENEPENPVPVDLIAEIKGYQDELEQMGVEREEFDFENIPESFLPAIHEEVLAQLRRRKMFLRK